MNIFPVRWLLVALLALAGTNQALAATYFVNSNGGNDNYNGTAPAWTAGLNGPWQTLNKLANVTLAPNDTIYLACGGIWRETLRLQSSGATDVPITIAGGPTACNNPPLIDGAASIPAHAWVRHSGNIYRARLPIDLVANPTPTSTTSGWTVWSANNDAVLSLSGGCGGPTSTCMALSAGTGQSIAISNDFPILGGVWYETRVQFSALAGTRVKVAVRRSTAPYSSLAPDQVFTSTGGWQTAGISFRAPISVPNARIDVESLTANGQINLREAHVFDISVGSSADAVYVDQLQIRSAHHPNFGQFGDPASPFAPIAGPGGKSILNAANLVLPAGSSLTAGLKATIRTINWANEERVVSSVNGRALSLDTSTNYTINAGHGFFLSGALWMLDSPGEWFFDENSATLYVWMPNGEVPGNRVAVNSLPVGIDLSGRANITLKNINVRRVGTGALLKTSNAIKLSGVVISDTYDFGIDAVNCDRCAVQTSAITRTGLDAINLHGSRASGFTLTDSTIWESGASPRTDGWRRLPRPARGAVYATGTGAIILRNKITAAAYNGVTLGASARFTENYVGQTCMVLNDCGAVYTNFNGNNVTISGNVIEGAIGNTSGMPGTSRTQTAGIYLDDRHAFAVVTGNTVVGADFGVHMHNANRSLIKGNIIFGSRQYPIWMQESTTYLRADGDIFDNRIESNLIVPTTAGLSIYLDSVLGGTDDFATFFSNRFSSLYSPQVLGQQSPDGAIGFTVAGLKAAGVDAAAQVADSAGYATYLINVANLIPNGELGNGDFGWTIWNEFAPYALTNLRSCPVGPCLELLAGSSISLFSTPNFSVVGGKWYRASFDAAAGYEGQPISVIVRRGGGGSNKFESLMQATETFTGTTQWRRYSFIFKASKTVVAGNPATGDLGARLDFEKNQPGSKLTVARVELVEMNPAVQVPLRLKILVNRENSPTGFNCSELAVSESLCGSFVSLATGLPVIWPMLVGPLTAIPVSTRDTSLVDSDGDGVADQQDFCPNSPINQYVNAKGCGITQ